MKILLTKLLALLGVFYYLDIWERTTTTTAFVIIGLHHQTTSRRRRPSRRLSPLARPTQPIISRRRPPTKTNNPAAFSYLGYQNDVAGASTYSENVAYTYSSTSRRSTRNYMTPVTINGASLKTFSLTTPAIERVLLLLQTTGHPLNADIELWQGPDNCPQKIAISSEEGTLFGTVIQTPRQQNAISIRNTCPYMQLPLEACMQVDMDDGYGNSSSNLDAVTQRLLDMCSIPENFYGGTAKEYYFAPSISSVQMLLQTDGRPMNARIEIVQGANNKKNVKQVIEVFVEDGLERPFFAALETSWTTSTIVRVINAAPPSNFLLSARVAPYVVDANAAVVEQRSSWNVAGRDDSTITANPPVVRQILSKLKSLLRMIVLLVIGFESATHMTEIEALVLSPQAMVVYGQIEEFLSALGAVLLILWNKFAEVIWTVLSLLWNQLASLFS